MNSSEVLQRFEKLTFPVELEFGSLTATIGEIFNLRAGTVLQTNHPAGAPFTLRVGGIELAAAEVVVVDDSVSARISKMTESAKATAEGNGNS